MHDTVFLIETEHIDNDEICIRSISIAPIEFDE